MKKLILSFAVLTALAATSCDTSARKADHRCADKKSKTECCSNADCSLSKARNEIDSAAAKTGKAVKGAVDATKNKAEDVGKAVSDKASEVGDKVKDALDK